MATSPTGYIGGAIPVREIHASNTNLFAIAAQYFGDATLWTAIARMNNRTDPWIEGGPVALQLPNAPAKSNGGILGS